jgi:hypothetical protein
LGHRKEEIFVCRTTASRVSETSPIKSGDRWTPKPRALILSLKNSSFLLGKEIQFFRIIVHCRP